MVDSFITFGEKEVGTKIELKYNHETDLPCFAVCRHPNQILSEVDRQGFSLPINYGLSLSDFRYLKAFESIDQVNGNLLAIYQNFAFNDSKSVKNVALSSRGQYSGTAMPSLVSKPDLDKDNWSSFWHPLYGTCFAFQLSKPLVDVVGEAGIEFVKVNLDFEKAFPVQGPEPEPEIIVIQEQEAEPDPEVILDRHRRQAFGPSNFSLSSNISPTSDNGDSNLDPNDDQTGTLDYAVTHSTVEANHQRWAANLYNN